ncbi:chemotaxis protein [Roseospira marina]|uniref:Chemotaxis protein n=1 Tax=Roseospira marina TaxID=140057 RepID=A0A5M6I9Y4_9PROT|nr:PocR ligand-binding domain-containing protein [Roseospira marina]KAA5605086.1 chemotaxis protein [Roseospira marina]MBB4314832.1 ligand-binding sensor protein [Roseospira marina]MBB5087832.1 ligand-binding sensor protein [Roseospira marina]
MANAMLAEDPAPPAVELSDIMEPQFWQRLQDAFSKATGLAAVTVDTEKPVSNPSNFTRFCMDLVRKSPEGLRRCMECDLNGGKHSRETGRPSVYDCHAGLVDMAAPIIVDGEQVGSVIGGQVLTQEPDEAAFRRYAEELDINPDTYIEALRAVPRTTRARVEAAADLLYLIATEIGNTWHQQRTIANISEAIHSDVAGIRDATGQLQTDSAATRSTQTDLEAGITDIRATLENINGVLTGIRTIAGQTRLLGLNASIEAARAGHVGLGFNIIAQEVRALSEHSRRTVDEIESFTANIQADTETIIGAVSTLATALDQQAASVVTLEDVCDRISRDAMEIGALVQKRRD